MSSGQTVADDPASQAAKNAATAAKEDAWTNAPAQLQAAAIKQAKDQQAQVELDKKNALTLTNALTQQRQFQSQKNTGGTILTSPLGVVGTAQPGQKTVLGQ